MEIIEQRTHAWLMQRVGHVTASRFKAVLAKLKNGAPSQARQDYLIEVACERITGMPTQNYVNAAMQWGTEQEPFAREAYVARTGRHVDEVGFVKHPELMVGVSPDGVVELEGLIEIKAPNSSTHVYTLTNGMDPMHMAQIQGQLWVTGYDWCDFVSFDPRMPAGLELYIQRVPRDADYISRLDAEVRQFLVEVDAMVTTLKNLQGNAQ